MNPLMKNEIDTLIAMARVCKSIADAEDALYLFGLLAESHKAQLKKALRGLPRETKRLLRDAAASQQKAGRAVA